jgi:SH3-like domain-containing protein
VIVNIRSCDGAWRLVDGDGFKGYIRQVTLCGAYPTRRLNEQAWTGEPKAA